MSDPFALRHWLKLSLVEGLGYKYLHALLRAFESPGAVCDAPHAHLRQVVPEKVATGITGKNHDGSIETALRWSRNDNCHIITLIDPCYPRALHETINPPPLLYARGNLKWLQNPLVAIVGSRNASSVGVHNTKIFARALSENGITVVSGLAHGIDAAAHRGALAGEASTIAVIGTGIDQCYPRNHHELRDEVVDKGLLLSEFPLGAQPRQHHFPRRNRVIGAMSRACLVMEATRKSGALITAEHANEQGREVFAVPGSINSPLHRGCHRLIRDGATLVENVDDILTALNIESVAERQPAYQEQKISETIVPEGRLLSFINFEPTSIDDIAARTGIAVDILLPEILELEMNGKIAAISGGRYQRI